jgi:hypothetical protein
MHEAVKVVEKWISDEEFRKSFFSNPNAAIARTGIAISEEEMAGLGAMDAARFSAAMAELNERFSETSVGAAQDVPASLKDLCSPVAQERTTSRGNAGKGSWPSALELIQGLDQTNQREGGEREWPT